MLAAPGDLGTNRPEEEQANGDRYHFNRDGGRWYVGRGSNYLERYWYDGLGRTSGLLKLGPIGTMGPNRCLYDGDGQMVKPCDNDSLFRATTRPTWSPRSPTSDGSWPGRELTIAVCRWMIDGARHVADRPGGLTHYPIGNRQSSIGNRPCS